MLLTTSNSSPPLLTVSDGRGNADSVTLRALLSDRRGAVVGHLLGVSHRVARGRLALVSGGRRYTGSDVGDVRLQGVPCHESEGWGSP